MNERIQRAITDALTEVGAPDVSFVVEWPGDLAHGDYATNVALAGAKVLGKNPREVALDLAPRIQAHLGASAASVTTAGPGFINITLAAEEIAKSIAAAREKSWGKGTAREGTRVVVEYSCPNPFKEMHIGHLMSTVIGEAISRSVENAGAAVIRDTYGGDVGPHVAKALWALQREGMTDVGSATEVDAAYARGSRAYEESDAAKQEIDALNRTLYAGTDAALMNLWRTAREVCLESFRDLYDILGTKFDYFFFESETAPIGMEVVRDGLARGVFEESEGAVIYRGEKKGFHTLVFITSHGTPTYETKDLGLAFLKEEKVPNDASIIITASEQIGHFKVFLAALEESAPLVAAKTLHVPHGFMRLTSGKMSSREGNTISAAALLESLVTSAKEKNEDVFIAQQVAVAAVKYMILRQAPGGDIIFDPEKSLSLEGDSGPYLQYAYVRARSVLAQAAGSDDDTHPETPYDLERLITRFPEVAARAEREHAPHHIAQYLTVLAGEWNAFYAKERIIGGTHQSHKVRVAEAFANTMHNGLTLLGIPVPEKM